MLITDSIARNGGMIRLVSIDKEFNSEQVSMVKSHEQALSLDHPCNACFFHDISNGAMKHERFPKRSLYMAEKQCLG